MKVGEIVKIKTPLDFCGGVYNNVEARVKKISGYICYVDLIKEKDKIRVDHLGYITRGVQINVNVSYCRAKVTKLNI